MWICRSSKRTGSWGMMVREVAVRRRRRGGVGVWGNLDDFSVTGVHIKLENFSVLDGLRRGCGNHIGRGVCESESLLSSSSALFPACVDGSRDVK